MHMKTKLALASIAALGLASAQGAITLGDVAVVGISGDNKIITWVALNDLGAGDTVSFTDSGWKSGGSFRANEGGATFTVPAGGILAGTVLTAGPASSNSDWDGLTNYSSLSNGDVGTNGLNLSTSGDQALMFTGAASSPTFVFAAQSNSTSWQADSTSSNDSALPTGLTDGINAVSYGAGSGSGSEFDNVWYSGTTSFSSAGAALAAIADQSNWSGDDTNYSPITTIAVPEPSTYAALAGLLALGFVIRRRMRK